MMEKDLLLNNPPTYNRLECLCYTGIFTLCWFFVSHVLPAEKLVFPLLPRIVQQVLNAETKKARIRVKQKKLKAIKESTQLSFTNNTEYLADTVFLLQLRNRSIGIINALFALFYSFYCLFIKSEKNIDYLNGINKGWMYAGSCITGYFVWDLIIVLVNYSLNPDSWQWLLHAVICGLALISTFFARVAPMTYYGERFLLLELSTPFMGYRWFALKCLSFIEQNPSYSFRKNDIYWYSNFVSVLFGVSFVLVRMIYAPIYLFIPIYYILFAHYEESQQFNIIRWWVYVISIPSFIILNVYWLHQIIKATRASFERNKEL